MLFLIIIGLIFVLNYYDWSNQIEKFKRVVFQYNSEIEYGFDSCVVVESMNTVCTYIGIAKH